LDTGILSEKKAAMADIAGWQKDPGSDDEFDADVPSQAGDSAVHSVAILDHPF
jgi:hypothetical protein